MCLTLTMTSVVAGSRFVFKTNVKRDIIEKKNLFLFLIHRSLSNGYQIGRRRTQVVFQPVICHRCFGIQYNIKRHSHGITSGDLLRDHKSSLLDPYKLLTDDLSSLHDDIRKEIVTDNDVLGEMGKYYFDGQGKSFRPMLVMLLSKALNFHHLHNDRLLAAQRKISIIAEIIHTASLIHDDVIDSANTRRGKASINSVWGHRKVILTGDFILSIASIALARIGNEEVVQILSQVIEDLVKGEFMQLGSKEDENERFSHYLKKTFKKTASLLANSCKAVAVLGKCSEEIIELAYEYGRNIGIAFQLIDDLLDFTSCDTVMGKPTAADLRLGLATAPVLFAAQKYPELNSLIMRRFKHDGDVEMARDFVAKSDGVLQTRMLAEQYGKEAIRWIRPLESSDFKSSLIHVVQMVLDRQK